MTGPTDALADVGDRVLFARLERPKTADLTRIAIVGDPHVATRSRGTHRVFHRTEQRLRAVIDDVNQRDVDLVVVPGDLTKDGEPWNYDRVDALLDELVAPFLATPGNHDLRTRGDEHDCPSAAAFADRYASGSLPVRHRLGEIELFVVNSSAGSDGPYADTHRGCVSERQLEWLGAELAGATTPVVVSHHNPFPIVSEPLCTVGPWETFTIRDRHRLHSVLENHSVSLVVAGHHHLPSLVKRGGIRQLIAPATASYPQAYCLLEVDETGTNVWLVSHASESGRDEAYELAADGPAFRRSLLGITESMLDDLPVLYEPPRVDGEPLIGE
ncbi:metallophosphoesterase [Halostagnicola sp. A-GB9-2]|uniref:metallophosphoesterase family protein n=1 Tax=Halostagnicola sp. A-GB9-2 TaxID=3048066 RepID=UPI0024BF4772|nr:metallophosphoesterase [Halostagnicola sp. A-GB9-2]MDJ1433160.1 metallophosphoesterase [Halostagnicola sp. A-GB9-2]